MKVKIWKVSFSGWTTVRVVARNIKEAIKKAWATVEKPHPRGYEIDEIKLIAEAD